MISKLILIILFSNLLFSFEERNLLSNQEILVSEYDLKAVFIYHFIKYFEWSGLENKDFFEISVFGDSEILKPLKEIASKKLALGRKIKINKIENLKEIGEPQILFLPKNNILYLNDILKRTENLQILIIGEEEGICKKGVAINFILKEGNVKFEINEAVLKRKGIRPSSQVLKLAISRFGADE